MTLVPKLRDSQDIIEANPSIKELIQTPQEQAYVDGMASQHFRSEDDGEAKTMGSVIYSESCAGPIEALELIADKLGKSDAADREVFLEKGAPASAMLPFAKYYLVPGIKGKSRIVSVNDLSDEQIVTLKPSPKGTPSIVITESEAPAKALQDVDYATVIVGPAVRNGVDGQTIWAMHAGFPAPQIPIQREADNRTPSKDSDGRMMVPKETGWRYGDRLTIAEIKAKLGSDIFISVESDPVSDDKDKLQQASDTTRAAIKELLETPLEGRYFIDKGAGGLLGVEVDLPNENLDFGGINYVRKPEMHVSLISAQTKLEKLVKANDAGREAVIALISEGMVLDDATIASIRLKGPSNKQSYEAAKAALAKAAEGINFKVILKDEFRRAEKGEARSVIQMCDVEGAEAFYRQLETLLGLPEGTFKDVPFHVTLYTGADGQGIGIVSQEQLGQLTTPVGGESLTELKSKLS
ncbi:hypothetical protein CVV38_04360 [Candidatus Peregrinibacteria bacterium HGW-Peregrinibacteria-1]|jgi:hypothetical protein|nr:MAG: hypothetical protein CVV38_04360 [Candidatus Peregrinibacteria bacterium HGW-Peregrinibacteria-1]